MQTFYVLGVEGAGDSWDPIAGQLVGAQEGCGAPKGVWECQPVWALEIWWGSERLAGLRKDGSHRKLQAGPGCQIPRKVEDGHTWSSALGPAWCGALAGPPGSCSGLSLAEGREKPTPIFSLHAWQMLPPGGHWEPRPRPYVLSPSGPTICWLLSDICEKKRELRWLWDQRFNSIGWAAQAEAWTSLSSDNLGQPASTLILQATASSCMARRESCLGDQGDPATPFSS